MYKRLLARIEVKSPQHEKPAFLFKKKRPKEAFV
jgi:hypothetical protein